MSLMSFLSLPSMHIYISNKQKDLSLSRKSISPVFSAASTLEKLYFDEVGIHFIDSKRMCALHEELFQDPSLTDCISCPIDPPRKKNGSAYCMLGDIFVCPAVAVAYAEKHDCDPYEELTLYVVHGLLHLMGYDDIEEIDRKEMRQAEEKHLENLSNLGLYLKQG